MFDTCHASNRVLGQRYPPATHATKCRVDIHRRAARVEDLAPEVGHVRARVRRALDHPLEVPALGVLKDGVRAPADHEERVARTKSEPSGCLEPTALRGDAELLPAVGIQGNHL